MSLSDIQRRIQEAASRTVSKANPLLESIPFPSFRPHQIDAIERVVESYRRGCEVVVLDAPTGSGKTLIAESVRRLLNVSGIYTCTTKSLQDQVARDFPYSAVLKGRGNYPTELRSADFTPSSPFSSISCGDCTWSKASPRCNFCTTKRSCPYEVAKGTALAASLAVLNTSYFLTEANGPGRFSDRELVIIDEADVLEQELMGFVEVEITKRRINQYQLPVPKLTVRESWREWLEESLPFFANEYSKLPENSDDTKIIRERKYLSGLHDKLKYIQETFELNPWVYTGSKEHVAFKPTKVDKLGPDYLWKHSKKWLLMSGTIISSSQLLSELGYTGQYETVTVNNTFDVSHRPVYFIPAADMSKNGQENGATTSLSSVCKDIALQHEDENILLHSVSYKLSAELYEDLSRAGFRVHTYTDSSGRERALNEFKDNGGILVGCSLDRGIDLPDDLCRVVVICKVPYPYLGDRQVSGRLYGSGDGQIWYTVQTIRTLIQMAGRGVRSKDDYATTYILDQNFESLYGKYRHLFPKYYKEAVRFLPEIPAINA